MIETTKVSEKIEQTIQELNTLKEDLESLAQAKVSSANQYDKEVAKTLMQLKAGQSFEFEGETVSNPPVTIIEKIAKGILWERGYNKDYADLTYKNQIKKIEIAQAQLNGWQSVYRHLSET